MSDLDKRVAALSPDIAERLRQRLNKAQQTTASHQITPYPRTSDTLPLSFAQQRLWFLDRFEPDRATYNVPLAFRLRGPLQVQAFERALNEIVRRHEALRTTFVTPHEQPLQRFAPTLVLPLTRHSLRHLSPAERDTELDRLSIGEGLRPFNLAEGPLVRWQLIELDEQDNVLFFTLHHIVTDGWSLGIIMRELSVLYEAYIENRASPLPEPTLQYADYGMWQRRRLEEEGALDKQVGYWREQLADAPPTSTFPPDFPRPSVQSFEGHRLSLALSKSLYQGLLELGRSQKATLFMTLLGAFQLLLYRYTGQEDVLIGTPIAGRTRKESETLVGLFINTLVLRTQLTGNPTFRELLGRVRDTALDAYGHQEVPFEKLIEHLAPARNLSYTPFFQLMFILQNIPGIVQTLSGLKIESSVPDFDAAKFDLSVMVYERVETFMITFEYNRALFTAETITRLMGHYQTLLEAIVARPDSTLSDLPILTATELAQLNTWNQTQTAYPPVPTLQELVERQVERTPDAVALEVEGQTVSYAELNARANQVAHRLRAEGIGPERLVGVYLERSPELLIALLAVLKAGGAYVPLDPTYPPARLADMIADAGLTLVLTQPSLHDSLPPRAFPTVDVPTLTTPLSGTYDNPAVPVEGSNLAYVIYTSGSTGRPKGVQICHSAVVNFLQAMQTAPGLTASDVLVAVTTFAFDISILELFLPLTVGARVVLASRETASDGQALATLLTTAQATVLQATPAAWRLLLASGWEGQATLKMLCGGEALPPDLAAELRPRGASLWNMYGPTEGTVWSTTAEVQPEGKITVGRPLHNTEAYVLDRALNLVPVGVSGELYLGGVQLARGYRHRAALTAERFIPHPLTDEPGARLYATGDVARWQSDGTLLVGGRNDSQVKLRGFRIELGEIEATLGHHIAVAQTVVLLREVRPNDPALVAYVCWQEGASASPAELRTFLRKTLPDYMIPAHIVTVTSFALTPTGKIDRQVLPNPGGTEEGVEDADTSPTSAVEEAIADIWGALLGRETIGIHTSFFDIGGHSLLATQAIARLNEAFDIDLPLRRFFEQPTIAELAVLIETIILDEITALDEAEAQEALFTNDSNA